MISKAFLQEQGNGRLREEESLVLEELTRRGMPITFYTEKRIHRRQLPLDAESLVVGDMPCITGALKQLGIPEPAPNDYPNSLQEFLHRKIWQSTLGELESRVLGGTCSSIFVKPMTRRKRFTGFVCESEYDLSQVYGVSRYEQIWCAEWVTWLSEYRVYVVHSEMRAVSHYAGNPEISIDLAEVHRAISALEQAGESYSGYAIDFGVLASGETALVEMNEGFAIGAYIIDSNSYTDMLLARWEELLAQCRG